MDRQDGTGRGRRGDRKDGDRRGGWGGAGAKSTNLDGEATADAPEEEEKKQAAPVQVEEEEEEVGFTLEDYILQKQATSKGQLVEKKEMRQREKVQEKTQAREGEKVNVQGIANNLAWRDTHAMTSVVNANLLGFQAPVDEDDGGG